MDHVGNNNGLFSALGRVLTESADEGAYHAHYDSEQGVYHVKHRESGRVVAHNVANSGGAALAAADRYNANPSMDKVANPTHEHLMDAAHSHADLKTAHYLLRNSSFNSPAATRAVGEAKDKAANHLNTLHANFAKNNPDHEHANRDSFDNDVRDAHDRVVKGVIEDGTHHD